MINKSAAVVTALTILFAEVPLVAQHTPVCYMQMGNGQIVNLESLCGNTVQKPTENSLSAREQQFLKDYQQALEKSPEAQAALASADPQAAINTAREVCKALDEGKFIEFRRSQLQKIVGSGNPTTQRTANFEARAIQTIAPKYFCPGFDN